MQNREIALVRCRIIGPAEQKIFSELSSSKVLDAVYYVVDNYSGEQDIPDDPSILELNQDFIDRLGLKYLGLTTGWVMGDYSLYRALEVDWSHCWLFEPDMKLPSDLDNFLQEHIDLGTDLVCLGFRPVNKGWEWTSNIERLSSREIDFFAMYFGPLRISRPLVFDGLDFRREILSNMNESQTALDSANDESVIASIAAQRYSVASFTDSRFRYFNVKGYWYHEEMFGAYPKQLAHPVLTDIHGLCWAARGTGKKMRSNLLDFGRWQGVTHYLWNCFRLTKGNKMFLLTVKYFLLGLLVKKAAKG